VDWRYFDFSIGWANLHKAYDLRTFHNQIAPPFNKYIPQRAIELEDLHDDIDQYQMSKTPLRFILWVIITGLWIDYEAMDRPIRHPLVEDRTSGTITRTRITFMQDDA
jgi:hypothetical protein